MPKEPITYTQRYATLSGRTAYADYVRQQQAIDQGLGIHLDVLRPNNESSGLVNIHGGQFATTADELASYLQQSIPVIAPEPPTVPQAPLSLCVIPSNASLTIFFIQGSTGGSPITNYSYSTNGVTYTPLSPADTSSPLTISGLTNGTVYTIYLKAINEVGSSSASTAVTAAPIPSSFSPASIAGLNVWLDGHNATNVILADGQVSAWNDSSSATNNFTAGGGTITYDQPSSINNRPALTFVTGSPTSTYLAKTFNITPGQNQLSLFMVVTQTGTGTGNSELFYTSNNFRYFDVFNSTNDTGLLKLNAGTATQNDSTVNIITTPPTLALISVVLSTTSSMYVNGTITAVNGATRGVLSLDASLDWSISGAAFLGSVGEVITYPTALTNTEREKIESYLAWKWGLQSSLPATNPWKNTPPTGDTAPGAPTLLLILAGNGTAYTYYTAGTGTTVNYEYTTNAGTSYTTFSPPDTVSPNAIPGLTNGTPVTVQFRAYNGGGVSSISNGISVTPDQPSVPSPWLLFDPNNTSSYSGTGTTLSNVGSFGALSGTISGTVTYGTGTGIAGKVFTFNGGYIAFPSFDFGSAFTISAWVNPSTKFSINGLLTNGFANVNTAGFKFGWNSWQSTDKNILFENGDGTAGNWSVPSTVNNTVTMDVWQMLTVIVDRTGQSSLFLVNGVPVGVVGITTASNLTVSGAFNIGAYMGGSYTMKAELGLLKVFNSTLTASQVYDDFTTTKAAFGL